MPRRSRWNWPWPEQVDRVAQAVLPAVAAIELEPRGARRQVEVVVREQAFGRLDLPVAQRRATDLPDAFM
jgi:hypothetical protein